MMPDCLPSLWLWSAREWLRSSREIWLRDPARSGFREGASLFCGRRTVQRPRVSWGCPRLWPCTCAGPLPGPSREGWIHVSRTRTRRSVVRSCLTWAPAFRGSKPVQTGVTQPRGPSPGTKGFPHCASGAQWGRLFEQSPLWPGAGKTPRVSVGFSSAGVSLISGLSDIGLDGRTKDIWY